MDALIVLDGVCQPEFHEAVDLPAHLKEVKRLPAVRRHHGPLRPTSIDRQRLSVRARIVSLRLEGADEYTWWFPDNEPMLVQSTYAAFDSALSTWCASDDATEADFHNKMFEVMCFSDEPEMKLARIFVQWIEQKFYDTIPEDLDPDRRLLLERAYMSLLDDLPTWQMRLEMKRLTQLWLHLPSGSSLIDDHEASHIEVRAPRPYQRSHDIRTLYDSMQEEEIARLRYRVVTPILPRPPCGDGPWYIVHLYSGRRREEDFQHWMQSFLNEHQHGACFRVLSVDTAIDKAMNVHSTKLWEFLIGLARAGRLRALLLGPPCETWSAARFMQLLSDAGRKSPRPLRLASSIWGLNGLSTRELLQISVGNTLLLRGLWLAVSVALHKGAVILEHPMMPLEQYKPSIWRTAVVLLLVRRPFNLFYTKSIRQWKFGAMGIKPTTFLCANVSLEPSLDKCALEGIEKPQCPLIGVQADGSFRTAGAKEYPSALNRAFADAFISSFSRLPGSLYPERVLEDPMGSELAVMCARLDSSRIQPDFQPEMAFPLA